MAIINCPNCGKICNTKDSLNCYMCGVDLTVATTSRNRSPKPSIGMYAKLGLGLVVLIIGWFGVSTVLEWRSAKAKDVADRKEAAAVALFDYIKFENDETAIENAMKQLPAKFSFRPPTVEIFQKQLATNMSQKDTYDLKPSKRDGGIQSVTKTLVGSEHATSEQVAEVTQGSVYKGHNKYEFQERVVEHVDTATTNKNQIVDLKLIDFSYVKAPGDLLVCFARYEVKTALIQTNTETVQSYPGTDPAKSSLPKPTGNKIRDDVATENAKFEFKEGRWHVTATGISEFEKLKQISELKAGSKAAPAR